MRLGADSINGLLEIEIRTFSLQPVTVNLPLSTSGRQMEGVEV